MTTINPKDFAAAYSAKFGKPMTLVEAEEYLASASSAATSNAEADAHNEHMVALGYISVAGIGFVLKAKYDADKAANDEALAGLTDIIDAIVLLG
jgi:hypothetical protein